MWQRFNPFYRGNDESKNTNDVKKDEKKLKLDHFVNKSTAKDFICKICQFIVTNPKEHKTDNVKKCTSLFCSSCIRDWIEKGKTNCPSTGCLTSGFNENAFRDIGSRDTIQLNNLLMVCPYSCGSSFSYLAYLSSDHGPKCLKNPVNICIICESSKTNGTCADCASVFKKLKNQNKILNKKIADQEIIIATLRKNLDEMKAKEESNIKTETENKNNSKNEPEDKTNKNPEDENPKQKGSDSETTDNHSESDSKTTDESGNNFKEQKQKIIYISNNCFNKPRSIGLTFNFHYGNTTLPLNGIEPSLSFRTIRLLLTDTLGSDPGIIILVQHRVLQDTDVIKTCGFRPGNNIITIIKGDTPNYSKPGYKFKLYPFFNEKPGEPKPYNRVKFYSNNLERLSNATQIGLTFGYEDQLKILYQFKTDQTIGDLKENAKSFLGDGPTKLIYLTHLILKDNMYISDCGFQPGITEISLFPNDWQNRNGYKEFVQLCIYSRSKSDGRQTEI